MSTPPAPAPGPDPRAGMKGKLFLFRQNAVAHGLSDDEINAAVAEFETSADVDTALGFWRDNAGPAALQKKDAETKQVKLNKAGTPPDKLPESKAEVPVYKFNSKAISNVEHMNIWPGACPALRHNPETGDDEVI